MKYNNYAHIELNIISKSKQDLGNTANYKNLAKWNDSAQGNVTTVGTNGLSNYYGLFDISGQVYEWTDSYDEEYSELKICRGGCYADKDPLAISKNNRKKFYYHGMLNEGFFGFRVASLENPYNLNLNFSSIQNTGNVADNCENNSVGSVDYNYLISSYLITNEQYCEFLNSIDPSGINKHKIYDGKMNDSAVGGISLKTCNTIGNKYIIKNMMDSKPATFIKWTMAAKFTNWLHNNKSSDELSIYSGAYNLSNSIIVRESEAKYFLPNENEWYKAAYFDPNKNNNGPGYWTYGTASDDEPLAVLSNEFGIAAYAEGYHYSNKKFPIIVNKNFESFGALPESSSNPVNPCPIINISGQPASSTDNYLYFINSTISNLEYGYTYNYNFSSSFANWPSKISPLSGTFTAYGETQEINAILEFCPKNFKDINVCDANLDYSNLDDNENNCLINLDLTITPTNSCNNNISQNLLVSATGLPTINPFSSKYINIEFLDSGNNAIMVSGNLCCQPIPITINVSGHQPGDLYDYSLQSSSPSVELIPDSGTVSFSNQIGRITTFAIGLRNNISVLTANIIKQNDPTVISSDQVLLQCITDCTKSCENHANFNKQAVWGPCVTIDCDNLYDVPISIESRVTTVGSNGGPSSYGTYDMDGNVWELVHAGDLKSTSPSYKIRGGSFNSSSVGKGAVDNPDLPNQEVGFRVGSYSNIYNYPNYVCVDDIGIIPTGNKSDFNNYGSVPYSFRINKYPVTNCDYAEFLNKIASTGVSESLSDMVYYTGMSGCYGGIDRIVNNDGNYAYNVQECMYHKPVRFLNTYAILKYINWINNNKPDGWETSNTGTYLLNNSVIISGNRSACSEYFLPSENEWYKAAYYKGNNTNNTDAGYWNYSTQASVSPDPVLATDCGEGSIIDCEPKSIEPVCTQYPLASLTPTPTISVTPTITPTISVTPSVTPTISVTPSVTPTITPTISVTPSVTPTISVTPSVTPTISVTPSVTPTITPTISVTPTITPTNPAPNENTSMRAMWQSIACSSDGQKIVAGTDNFFWNTPGLNPDYSYGSVFIKNNEESNWTRRILDNNFPYDPYFSCAGLAMSSNGMNIAVISDTGPENSGYKPGSSPIYISTDGGITWTSPGVDTNNGFIKITGYWRSIAMSADGLKIIVAEGLTQPLSGSLLISSDGGATWTTIVYPNNELQRSWTSVAISRDGTTFAAVSISMNGELSQNGGYIYTSTDNGVTLVERTTAGKRPWIDIAINYDGNKLAAIPTNGYIYTSIDGGDTWIERTGAGQRSWISITSSDNGNKLAVASEDGEIYTSTDGGENWIQQINDGLKPWNCIASSSDGVKLFATNDSYGYINYSTDSGDTWDQIILNQ